MRHAASRERPRPRTRLRRWRLLAASGSALVVAVALLGAVGVLPLGDVRMVASTGNSVLDNRSRQIADRSVRAADGRSTGKPAATPRPTATPSPSRTPTTKQAPAGVADATVALDAVSATVGDKMPAGTGNGKRIVYTLSGNHVWLVDADNTVRRSYLVSGTKFGQVSPGTYHVLRKRRHTTSYDGADRMQYMVTFTHGRNAAIGFHDIPIVISTGKPIQTRLQLGQSLSDGCVRQDPADAKALWEFAPVGTNVVVLR
ncbi:L,D-transpeptidase [Actinopolymorpha singaporensis]|uniref:Lipoprotein-anchoring transpeptidase ErfK/SrfK n=1 Tax=Actinopolymorpha singaporensis TaxID=117157 RepID=A0A1H1YS74_9ACTN|nr:L,D-transpeptidase [Actinopolymorpha singaporensis]SDT24308.1 Lipoprotein-anchoring transpeptidase ErfK/SrfK [Actinopolymorpha singaporensis]